MSMSCFSATGLRSVSHLCLTPEYQTETLSLNRHVWQLPEIYDISKHNVNVEITQKEQLLFKTFCQCCLTLVNVIIRPCRHKALFISEDVHDQHSEEARDTWGSSKWLYPRLQGKAATCTRVRAETQQHWLDISTSYGLAERAARGHYSG